MDADKFRNKYRIASARLASWDYGSNAAYFVTICTKGRAHAFGEVRDGQVHLTPLGEEVWSCWRAIPEHFPFVVLGAFVVMPNHVHGIIIIAKPVDVGTQWQPNQFGPQSQNLASIVRGFKIGVTKYARQHQIVFTWQARYHDHIIRNAAEHDRISKYIVENPQKWTEDRYHAG